MQKLVEFLQNKNIEVVMLTGDNENVASNIASQIGIKNILLFKHQFQKSKLYKELKKSIKQ